MTVQTLVAIVATVTGAAAVACMLLGARLLARATALPFPISILLVLLLTRGATSALVDAGGIADASFDDLVIASFVLAICLHASWRARRARTTHPQPLAMPVPGTATRTVDAEAA